MRTLTPRAAACDDLPLPVDATAFAARLDPLAEGLRGGVAVAVSGGPDSMALLHLADVWASARGRRLVVYTVDHGLRTGAAAEAAAVARVAGERGRRHRTLVWRGEKPPSGLQAAARDARYRLLLDACRADRVSALLLAHHGDDQAETVLHRIERDTGPGGLAGMLASREVAGIRLLRPLLDLPKDRLVATCRDAGIAWFDDPSNRDPRFARTVLRELAPLLADAGVTAERLGRLATAMATARRSLDGFADDWMAVHADIRPAGAVALDLAALEAAPLVLQRHLLDRALRAIGGGLYPVRGERLARLLDWCATGAPGVRTLGGCRIELAAARLTVLRDWRQAAQPVTVASGGTVRWDGRFDVENATPSPVRIGVCGIEGWRRWRRTDQGRAAASDATIPHAARLALPAVVDLDGGIALPHLVSGAPAPSGWIGEAVRVRFRPTLRAQ